jgi:hypothetical protein
MRTDPAEPPSPVLRACDRGQPPSPASASGRVARDHGRHVEREPLKILRAAAAKLAVAVIILALTLAGFVEATVREARPPAYVARATAPPSPPPPRRETVAVSFAEVPPAPVEFAISPDAGVAGTALVQPQLTGGYVAPNRGSPVYPLPARPPFYVHR